MIVYLDTSSLVKLYVLQEDSHAVEKLVESSDVVATSLIAYAEARSAFARRLREDVFSVEEYRLILSRLDQDWDNCLKIGITGELVRRAGDLSEKHGIRGFDAIHLSSAISFREELSFPVYFSCSDKKLQNASGIENLLQPEQI
jgi:predicted nucleic acid-binding protein